MQVEGVHPSSATVTFTVDELKLLANALNECCNGVRDLDSDAEFESRLGASRDEGRYLLREVGSVLREIE